MRPSVILHKPVHIAHIYLKWTRCGKSGAPTCSKWPRAGGWSLWGMFIGKNGKILEVTTSGK